MILQSRFMLSRIDFIVPAGIAALTALVPHSLPGLLALSTFSSIGAQAMSALGPTNMPMPWPKRLPWVNQAMHGYSQPISAPSPFPSAYLQHNVLTSLPCRLPGSGGGRSPLASIPYVVSTACCPQRVTYTWSMGSVASARPSSHS